MINPINPADKTKRAKIDWEAVERDYRMNQLTVIEIGQAHFCSVSGLMKRAKKEGWTRDLSSAVKLATKAKVLRMVVERVKEEVEQSGMERIERSTLNEIDAVASVHASIYEGKQNRTAVLASLFGKMTGELQEVTSDPQSLEAIAMALEDQDPKAAEGVAKLRSLSSRLNNLKLAADINARIDDSENSAFGLKDGASGSGSSIESLINEIEREEAAL